MKKRAKKAIVWVMLCVMLCTVLLPVKAYAAETAKSEEHVRGAQAQQERTAPVYTAELVRTLTAVEGSSLDPITLTVNVRIHVTYYLEEGVTSGILSVHYTIESAYTEFRAVALTAVSGIYDNYEGYMCQDFSMDGGKFIVTIGITSNEWGDLDNMIEIKKGRMIEE